jgi:hypothetical protein
MPTDGARIEKVHCNQCRHQTKHLVVATRIQHGSEYISEQFEISWRTTFDMLECCGCETVCMRRAYWFSEDPEEEESISYYPPPVSREIPSWLDTLAGDMRALIGEIYTALHADSRRLALMGARALIDLFMLEKVGDAGTFSNKLDKLVAQDYLSARSRAVLEAALDAGSAAAHRGYLPSTGEMSHVMDIIEHLLQHDQLENAAIALRKTTPKRKKGKK